MADDTPVVLVTGAAHGLGREVARQLAATGREVIITATPPRLGEPLGSSGRQSRRCRWGSTSVTRAASLLPPRR